MDFDERVEGEGIEERRVEGQVNFFGPTNPHDRSKFGQTKKFNESFNPPFIVIEERMVEGQVNFFGPTNPNDRSKFGQSKKLHLSFNPPFIVIEWGGCMGGMA